jgi:hypothetical protein
MDASGAFETSPCQCQNCGEGSMDDDVCVGGALDFTALKYVGETDPVSDPCDLISTESCLSYVGCKVNEYNRCALA